MKMIIHIVYLAALVIANGPNPSTTPTTKPLPINPGSPRPECTNPKVRREWMQLTAAEKDAYTKAAVAIAERPPSYQYSDPTRMSADDFTWTHAVNVRRAHGNQEFLVFHRAMLKRYEQAMESAGWSGGLVYFDEGEYSIAWSTASDLFSSQYFGQLTDSNSGFQCIQDGQFANLLGLYGQDTSNFQTSVCLARCGDTFQNFMDSFTVAQTALTPSKSLTELQGDDTMNYHGTGHMIIGGQCEMGNPAFSPRDPVFYLHHAYVDKIYWKWQNLCSNYVYDFEGYYSDGTPVNRYQPLDSWSDLTPQDVFDAKNSFLCYTYSESPGDIFYPHDVCDDGNLPNQFPFARQISKRDVSPAPTEVNQQMRKITITYTPVKDGTTLAEVTCGDSVVDYIIPAGCEVYKYFCNSISVQPVGYVHKWNSTVHQDVSNCPQVLYPPCYSVPVYERPDHLRPPTPSSKHQYPRFLTDDEVAARFMDICAVRKGDIKVMLAVDLLNAGLS